MLWSAESAVRETGTELLKLINYSCRSYPTRASYSGQVDGFRTANEKRVENTAVFENTRTKRLRMRTVSIFKIAVANANFTTRKPFFS